MLDIIEVVPEPYESNYEQGSALWKELRIGKITGSHFADIMPTARQTAKWSEGQMTYLRKVAGEILTGESSESGFTSKAMDDGHIYEPIARNEFSKYILSDIRECGFFIVNEMVGSSPDGLIGVLGLEYGTLEIKCPEVHTHLHYIDKPEFFWNKYKWQALGHMLVTRKEVGYLLSYNHFMPENKKMVVCEPPKGYKDDIKRLEDRLNDACVEIARMIA